MQSGKYIKRFKWRAVIIVQFLKIFYKKINRLNVGLMGMLTNSIDAEWKETCCLLGANRDTAAEKH